MVSRRQVFALFDFSSSKSLEITQLKEFMASKGLGVLKLRALSRDFGVRASLLLRLSPPLKKASLAVRQYLSQIGGFSRTDDYRPRHASGDEGAHEADVAPSGNRGDGRGESVVRSIFSGRPLLSCQYILVDEQPLGTEEAHVGWYHVAGGKEEDVARNQFPEIYF